MLTDHDVFFAGKDRHRVSTSGGTTTTTESKVLLSAGITVSINAFGGSESDWVIGQIVKFTQQSGGKYAHCRVTARVSSTVTLVPIAATGDTAVLDTTTFQSGSTITGLNVYTDVLTLVIDLSEATGPQSMYNYAFAASVGVTGYNGKTSVKVNTKGLCDDPYSGTSLNAASHTGTGLYLGTNLANWVWYELALAPGQRYEFRILIASNASGSTARSENPRIVAFRTDQMIVASAEAAATATSTSYQSIVDTAAITSDTAGTYLLLASWQNTITTTLSSSTVSTVRLRKVNGVSGTNYTQASWCPTVSGEYRAGGFAQLVTLVSGDTIGLSQKVESSGPTSSTRSSMIILVALPSTIVDSFTREIAAANSDTLPANAWSDMVTSNTGLGDVPSMAAGTWIDFIYTNNPASQVLRPRFDSAIDNDWEMRGVGNVEQPAISTGTREYATFWINRIKRDGSSAVNAIQARPTTTTVLPHSNCTFTFLREEIDPRATDGTPTLIAADVEAGVVLKRAWATGLSSTYTRECPEFELITRVFVNGSEYTRMTSLASINAVRQFYWNPTTKVLTVRIHNVVYGGQTYTDPSGQYVHVMVVSPYLVTRDGDVALRDEFDTLRQYEARLSVVPTITQELAVQSEGCEVGTSFGQIEIAATDGGFDDVFSQRVFDGLGIKVYRGKTGMDTKLRRMVPVVNANLGLPTLSTESLAIDVYDGSLVLKRPVTSDLIKVLKGEFQSTVEDTLLPMLYGFVRRVPAYRTATSVGSYSLFQCAKPASGYPLQQIGIWDLSLATAAWSAKAYYDQEDFGKTVTISAVSLTDGTFRITSSSSADHYKDDVVWVDVLGPTVSGSTTTIDTPGLIMLDLLRRAGVSDTMIVQSSFRLLDRRWRTQWSSGPSPHAPIRMGFAFTEQTFAEALTLVAKQSFTYWAQTRTGRFRIGVPEIEAQNLASNPGFESASTYPWSLVDGASATIGTSTVFYGNNSLQLSNGRTGSVRQSVLFPKPGKYTITALVSQQSGDNTSVRLSLVKPGNGFTREMSEPFEVSSTRWTRLSMMVELDDDEAGMGAVEVLPHATIERIADYPPVWDSLVLWNRPEELSGTAGSSIETWTNVVASVSKVDNTSGVAGSAPTLVNNAVAGYPAAYFKDARSFMTLGGSPFTADRGCIFMVVMLRNRDDLSSIRSFVSHWNGFRVGTNPGFFTQYYSAKVASATNLDYTSASVIEYVPAVVMFRKTAATTSTISVNGGTAATSSVNPQYSLAESEWYLGSNDIDNHAGSFYLAEVMMYDGTLTDKRVTTVTNYLLTKYGLQSASINIDSVEVVPVSASIHTSDGEGTHARNARVEGYEVRGEHFYEAAVPFNVNTTKPDSQVSRATITDNEARGIQPSYDSALSEALATLPTAGRVSIEPEATGGVSATNATEALASALGVANALALRFSRQGAQATFSLMDFERIPEVGEILYHEPVARISKTSSNEPLWQIIKVDDTSAPATELSITAERPIDPVLDRATIIASEIPLGAIVIVTGSVCPTDYSEVEEMRGYYASISQSADLNNYTGTGRHTHDIPHTHLITQHAHTATAASSASSTSPSQYRTYNTDFGHVAVQAGTECNGAAVGHTHGITNTSFTSSNSSAQAQSLSATVASLPSSNHVDHVRVLFCRRTARTASTISSSIIMGYAGDTAPANWSVQSSLNGKALRGANPTVVAFDRTTTGSMTQSSSGTRVTLTSVIDVMLWERVTVTNGGNTFHGIITEVRSQDTSVTIASLHENGDTVDGTVYASSSTVSFASQDIGATFTASAHGHHSSGTGTTLDISPHTHDQSHSHSGVSGSAPTVSASVETSVQDNYAGQSYWSTYGSIYAEHNHDGRFTSPNIEGAAVSSSSAGGTILTASDTTNTAPRVECMMIASGGSETLVPAGALVLYAGVACPPGWVRIVANGGVLAGKASGALAVITNTHSHTFTASAHDNTHNHGGSSVGWLTPKWADYVSGYTSNQTGNVTGAALYHYLTNTSSSVLHSHTVAVSGIQSVNAALQATSGTTNASQPSATLPPSRKLLLCQKT